ncbi:hypothetical protein ALC56_04513 [Trachymyrmex septentrionalis]|uniref:Uncharacterized protein n=1 Tax=Trachymyrmex septentrionalis TaxID=34720 RepID=A0A195FM08_9HYME|nr:hypothetical protein ALC56_04513 [Trachymyrmex septentrionalis]
MADTSLSLDDIIKKKSLGMRGRGGKIYLIVLFNDTTVPYLAWLIKTAPLFSKEVMIRRGVPNRGARANGSVRGRGSSQVIRDARFKIIQKNREKLTDARDKLAEIAKQSDARLKLDKIRASHYKKIDTQLPGISRKTGRNGRLSLSTNKMPSLMQHVLPSNIPTNYMQPSTRTVGYRPPLAEPYIGEMNMDYTDDYLTDSPSLRRTVSNEYAPTPPPPPPVFNINPISPYTWVKSRNTNVTRIPARKSEIEKERERQRDYNKLAARSAMVKTALPSYKEDWNFGTKSRTIVAEETADSKYYDSRNLREVGIKSRLDASGNKTRTLSVLSRPKASSSSSAQSNGYRIVVSNLQANVTQEDIKNVEKKKESLHRNFSPSSFASAARFKTLKISLKSCRYSGVLRNLLSNGLLSS